MQKVTALVLATLLPLSAGMAQAAETTTSDPAWHHHDPVLKNGYVNNELMFDGVSLTEEQRQQMRDLMHQARRDVPRINVAEMETMHRLITAKNFDQAAVEAQAEKMAQEQVARQVEMARVRNLMYNLLTDDQKAVLAQKHQQRMDQLQRMQQAQQQNAQRMNDLQPTSAQKLSTKELSTKE